MTINKRVSQLDSNTRAKFYALVTRVKILDSGHKRANYSGYRFARDYRRLAIGVKSVLGYTNAYLLADFTNSASLRVALETV
jgi:hypothetical protein